MIQYPCTLQIDRFRRLAGITVQWNEPSVVLVDGVSGSGKSSFCDAFLFALFGKPAVPSGNPVGDIQFPSQKVVVSIRMPHLSIRRSNRNPTCDLYQYSTKLMAEITQVLLSQEGRWRLNGFVVCTYLRYASC